jgi:D-glycero-beta-D-manno-heptose-7-phosphate kinase
MSGNHADLFEKALGLPVLVVGDVMMDAYLWGRVDRISPEAPVPVVHVTSRSARLGGAANVALNLKALGAIPLVVSMVGDDDNAEKLTRIFGQQELDASGLLRSASRCTTVKTRVISGHQHVVRVDEEQEDDLDPIDEQRLITRVAEVIAANKPAVMILEDYNKGVLTPNTITAIIGIAREAGVPIAVDPKKRNFFCYKGVELFKPNLKELREGLKVEVEADDLAGIRNAVTLLEEQLGNQASMITLSEHGMYIRQGRTEHVIPAHVRKIADVSGAGDTVISVAALALALQKTPLEIAELANLAGGLVCEEVGVVPIDPVRLKQEMERLSTPA